MGKLSKKARMYARSYGQPPYGEEIEGTAELLLQMADKLEEYEDTGTTPEQIREIDRLYAEKCKELAERQKKLAEYEELYEQGKLLKLPCAVGDAVHYRYDGIKIAPMRVEQIIIAKYGTALLLEYCGDDEQLKHWKINIESTALDCKTVFLTREEAEAALNEKR